MFTWDEKLNIGVKVIDSQHRELFERIDTMLLAMKDGKGKEEIEKTIDFLESYVIKHFKDEEEIQKKNNYDKYEIQREQHNDFKNKLQALKKKLNDEGTSSLLAIEVQRQMNDWWRTHISKMDKDLGSFLISKDIMN